MLYDFGLCGSEGLCDGMMCCKLEGGRRKRSLRTQKIVKKLGVLIFFKIFSCDIILTTTLLCCGDVFMSFFVFFCDFFFSFCLCIFVFGLGYIQLIVVQT